MILFINGKNSSENISNYMNVTAYGTGNGNAQVNFSDNANYFMIAGNAAIALSSGNGFNFGFGSGFGFAYVFNN